MRPTDNDYELVARYLDGEQVQLTAAQQALADEIIADGKAVAGRLDVAMPNGVLYRVAALLSEKLPLRRRWRRGLAWAAGAVAAAAVVLAVMLAPPADPPKQPTVQLSADEYVDQFLNAPVDEWETRAGLLAEEVADYHVRLALGEPWSLDLDITRVEEEITGFGLAVEEEAPTEWDAWNIPL